ncbi:MAG TPA: hypothetical protein VHW03_07965 [Chthoniobacterales bacterium]|nr:hypothetical protein [Chthoniobacterales bacterium]
MDETQARLILQAYRPGEVADAPTAEALRSAAEHPGLGNWFAEEQAFDRAIAAHLAAVPAPFGLRTRILAQARMPQRNGKARWTFGLAALAALVFLVAQGIALWRGPASPSPTDYAREMASFIQLKPALQMESGDLGKIKTWLAGKDAPPMTVPSRLAALDPVGCRILSFRGHSVTLICFHRERNRLAHLFVVDRTAMPGMKPGQRPIFDNENGWMTATWAEGNCVYMIAMQGGRTALEQYLPGA